MKAHPAAELFDMLPPNEIEKLGRSMQIDGQLHPVLVWRGLIIDGRNRVAACDRVGIKPKIKELPDGTCENDIVRMIIAANLHRRHIDPKRIPAIAAELATMMVGDNQHSKEGPQNCGPSKATVSEVSERLGVAPRTVEMAKEVKAKAPDLFEKIKKGEMRTGTAHREMKERAKPTDPDRADDRVVDAAASASADGYTKRMYQRHALIVAMDETEITAHIEIMRKDGYIK
jgi:ParB-like chromosome segregation protein Spo0J